MFMEINDILWGGGSVSAPTHLDRQPTPPDESEQKRFLTEARLALGNSAVQLVLQFE